MSASKRTILATLTNNNARTEVDGEAHAPLDPPTEWVGVESFSPSNADRTLSYSVTMRYRADVTLDTMITTGTQRLHVKGLQPMGRRNTEFLRLYCEEVL